METWIQWAVGLGVTITLTLVGFMASAISKLQHKLSSDIAHVHARIDKVKEEYVRRDDFKEFREDVKDSLARIEEKQDKLINMNRTH